MAVFQGRLGRIYVSDDGGSTFTLLGCVVDATLNASQEEIDSTCHEDNQFRAYITGRKEATIDATVNADKADTGQQIVAAAYDGGTELIVRWRMLEQSTLPQRQTTAIITSFAEATPNDDMATIDITFRLTGDFSETAQP